MRITVPLLFAASLAGCGVPDTTAASSEAYCRGNHCGPCLPDSSSPTGGSKTCVDCSGDSYTIECRGFCRTQVTNPNGAILPYPDLISVYLGDNFSPTKAAFHDATWSTLAPSTAFWSRMSEYGIHSGQYSGGYFIPGNVPSTVTDQNIRDLLTSQITQPFGVLPPPLFTQYLYIVYLPDGTRVDRNASSNHTGYHDSIGNLNVYYAVLDGVDTQETIDLVAAHEAEEAATDAILGQGWNIVGQQNGEIADICAPQNEVIDGRLVPTVWSQKSCSCK